MGGFFRSIIWSRFCLHASFLDNRTAEEENSTRRIKSESILAGSG
jgi:hypothetical protein